MSITNSNLPCSAYLVLAMFILSLQGSGVKWIGLGHHVWVGVGLGGAFLTLFSGVYILYWERVAKTTIAVPTNLVLTERE